MNPLRAARETTSRAAEARGKSRSGAKAVSIPATKREAITSEASFAS